jgi:cystathionine gamma-synthase
MKRRSTSKATLAVWAGEEAHVMETVTQVPVVHSVSFGYHDVDQWRDVALGRRPGHIYGRNSNPTVAVFEDKVRQLEGADAATSFSTGMAAVSNTLFALLSPGERCVSIKDTYGGTNAVFNTFLPKYGIRTQLCDTSDVDAIDAEIKKGCRLLYLESPTNPTCKVMDIARLAASAKSQGPSWWWTIPSQRPLTRPPSTLGPISCCTVPPSILAVTPMHWAAWPAEPPS